jgi:hypothetical protein
MINIIIEGGLVQGIESDDPALIGTDINVIDLDTEGADDDELGIVNDGGRERAAWIGGHTVGTISVTIIKIRG